MDRKAMKKMFLSNKMAVVCTVLILIIVIASLMAPLSPYDPDASNVAEKMQGISSTHILGTDDIGRDTFTRILDGGRISLLVGFAAMCVAVIVGTLFGTISGYMGGAVDAFMMRIVDALYSIPDMLYLIMITVVLGSNFQSIIIGICISSWMGMARQVRAQVMTLKEQEFSLAAFVLGASKKRILLKHLIINSMGPIIVSFTMLVPSAIFYEATLGFLGIGLSAPQASWGTLANDARAMISSQPLQVVWPILAICLTMLALNFIGDGLGDALDPKKK